MDGQPLWLQLVWLVALVGFFAYLTLGMRKTNRSIYDDPEEKRRRERSIAAAEAQARATAHLADAIQYHANVMAQRTDAQRGRWAGGERT